MANPIIPSVNPNNLGNAVVTRNYSWEDQVIRQWNSEWRAPDHGVYEFSNGRKFDSTDQTNNGIYNGGAK